MFASSVKDTAINQNCWLDVSVAERHLEKVKVSFTTL